METFEEMLLGGGHANSLGRANEVLDIVSSDHSRLDELFDCISADDAWVRMRAIDTFEKLVKANPDLARPYLTPILTKLTTSEQPSVQWHLAQIFGEVDLNDDQRKQAIKWLTNRIATTDVDWIVSVNTMKTLLHFYTTGFVEANELKTLFSTQKEHKSKSVRKKAATFLQEL
jgi:malonyl CoA-acyl carrier protein transacylase